jgi:GTP cyclohydrolase II
MINVNQMTSQLARMPDQALQQYAQMHKNDPYIMALAMSESNRRKSMRTGAQMNAPEEPKVVDQAIQGMASPMPEDVGIGQLPTGEMNFAGGGIVAFSDGGDVPRYQDRGLVQSSLKTGDPLFDIPGMTQGDLYAKALAKARQDKQGGGEPTNQDIKKALAFLSAPLAAAADVAMSPINLLRRSLTTPLTKEAENPPSFTPVMDARNRFLYGDPAQTAQAAPSVPSAKERLSPGDMALRQQPAPSAPPPAASGPGAGGPRSPAAPAAPAAPAVAASSFVPSQDKIPTMDEIKRMYSANTPKPEDVTDPFATQREELTNLATFQNAQERADFERQVKERGLLGEKQETRLKAREEKLGKQEKDLGPLAMLQAGERGVAVLLNCGEGIPALLGKLTPHGDSGARPQAQMDLRTYGIGAQILREMGVSKMKLLGSPRRMPSMVGYGLEVTGFVAAETASH